MSIINMSTLPTKYSAPQMRSCAAQVADNLGYCPGIGNIVGIIRIAFNLLSALGSLGMMALSPIVGGKEESKVKLLCACSEMVRGLAEQIPFLTYAIDSVTNFHHFYASGNSFLVKFDGSSLIYAEETNLAFLRIVEIQNAVDPLRR